MVSNVTVHYDPDEDELTVRFAAADAIDIDRFDDVELWFDHHTPGRLVSLQTVGMATVWNDLRRDEIRGLLGDELADRIDQLADHARAGFHHTSEPAHDTTRDQLRSIAHRRCRLRAGDPLPAEQAKEPVWQRWLRPLLQPQAEGAALLRNAAHDQPTPPAARDPNGWIPLDDTTAKSVGMHKIQVRTIDTDTVEVVANELAGAPDNLSLEVAFADDPSSAARLARTDGTFGPEHRGRLTRRHPLTAGQEPELLLRALGAGDPR